MTSAAPILRTRSVAFNLGLEHGFNDGHQDNPYAEGTFEWREYRIGYDYGVFRYTLEQSEEA